MATELKLYAELGHVHRTEPCIEYPGKWLLFMPACLQEGDNCLDDHPANGSQREHASQEEAIAYGEKIIARAEAAGMEYNIHDFSVCWACSDNDPRIGEVWFTPFYRAGQWSMWGKYRTT